MTTLNQTQFAKHIGVTKGYITQLKQAGRLVIAENGMVDVEASQLRIKDTGDANRDDVKARHEIARSGQATEKTAKKPIVKDGDHVSFSDGRAKEQHFKALQAELEYKKSIGELVAVHEMQLAVADVITTFRQSLENIPHLLAPTLIGKDLDFIRASLKTEMGNALRELEKNFDEKMKGRDLNAIS
jgi:regulator of replication initiation timing